MEPTSQNNGINAIKEGRKLFKGSNLSREETNKIREKLHKKESVYIFLKEKEQEGSLTNRQKRVLKNIDRYLQNFKKNLEKLQKYSITYGLDYLFNELDEVDCYEPKNPRVLLTLIMCYMKVKEIKIIN